MGRLTEMYEYVNRNRITKDDKTDFAYIDIEDQEIKKLRKEYRKNKSRAKKTEKEKK